LPRNDKHKSSNMLNISWGTKIAALYIGFVLLIGTMVFMCMNQKIDLVSSDYYEKELAFQGRITEMNNANNLSQGIIHWINTDGINLQFPSEFKDKVIKGEVYLFRPSDASKDIKTVVDLRDLKMTIPFQKLTKGMYKMQINWSVKDTSYFSEEIIVIP
jgi:hypothetical protein